ncbi:hypothetical protein J6590_081997 [Homalodisca vitripennis]|nr:hypothetical protein J6590_081997 [Homalodisca vitripennis]
MDVDKNKCLPNALPTASENAVRMGLQGSAIKLNLNLTNAYFVTKTFYIHLPSLIGDPQDDPVGGFRWLVTE